MNMEKSSNQNKKIVMFALLLSFFSIGILVFGFTLMSSDKVVMLQSVSNLYNKANNNFNDDFFLIDKIANSKDIGINANIDIKTANDNINLKFDYLENKSDSKTNLDIYTNYNDNSLINGNLLLSDKKIFVFLDSITPNYYYTDFDYIAFIDSLESNDYDTLLNLLKEAINDSIDSNDINKEKVTINYNGKDKKVTKLTYSINNKEVEEIVSNFISAIKNDKKLFNRIASLMSIDSTELSKKIDEYLEELKEKEVYDVLDYSVYYYGFNRIIEYQLYDYLDDMLFDYKVEDSVSTIKFDKEKVNYLTLAITKNKDNYTFTGNIYNNYKQASGSFTGTYKDNTLEIITNGDTSYKIVISYSINSLENEYKLNTNITLSTIKDNIEEQNISIDSSFNFYFDKKIDKVVSDSVNINEITEEELKELYQNIQNTSLYQLLSDSIFGNYIL